MAAFTLARPYSNRLRDLAIAGLIVFLTIQNGLPALRAFAQGEPGGAPSIALASTFIYQGRLLQDGVPQSGSFDLEFALFDVSTGGSALATLPVLENVAVENGLFSVQLNFASAQFAGQARWIEVRSRPGASVGPLATIGRQELTATPYANYATTAGSATTATSANSASSVPWSGVSSKPPGFADDVDDELTLPFTRVVTDASTAPLVSLTHDYGAGTSIATLGWKDAAVYGSGTINGVFGLSNGATGVYGENTAGGYGVAGRSLNAGGLSIGVLGEGLLIGVNGNSTGAGGIGVRGETGSLTGFGIFGSNSGGGIGIRGESSGSAAGVDGVSLAGGPGVRGSGDTGVFGAGSLLGVSGEGAAAGVRGFHSTNSATGSGVLGISDRGYGVFGSAPRSTIGATATGVYGEGGRIGVEGVGLMGATGVVGRTGFAAAYGVNGTNSGSGVGVIGTSTNGSTGIGVKGAGQGDGVRGETSTTGKAGISGIANGGANNDWAGYFVGNVNIEGTLTATVIGPSDVRLKKNIVTLSAGLAKILALRPVTFAWADGHDAERAHPGFIAQEVQTVLPEVVYEGSDEQGTLAMSSSELVPILVRAIQELEARIAELERRIP